MRRRAPRVSMWLRDGSADDENCHNYMEGEPVSEPTTERAHLQSMLRDYNEYPERRAETLAAIHERFTRTVAILVLDSTGFTRTTQTMGIVHFLALVERLVRTVSPLIEAYGGQVLKAEADNVYAVFPNVDEAVRAAVQMHSALRVANELLPANEEIAGSMGIGYGPMLMVGNEDAFGDEMNLACKLGEDLAEREEVLITDNAYKALAPELAARFVEAHFSVSGVEIDAHRLVHDPRRGGLF